MSNFTNFFFKDDQETPLYKIALALFGIIIIRSFLENFSSPYYTGNFFPAKEAYLHFPSYYISVFLTFALVLYFFTKKTLQQIFNFEIKIFLFVLIPPIADLIATNGKGDLMSYVITGPQNFLYLFFRLMDPRGFAGITLGIHITAYLIFFSMAFFIYRATSSFSKALLGILVSYALLFIYAISPSIIALPQSATAQFRSASDAYEATLNTSWIASTQGSANMPYLSLLQNTSNDTLRALFDSPLTQLFFIFIIIQLLALFVIYYPRLWESFKKNLRPERLAFWFFISFIGMFIEQRLFGNASFSNPVNLISLVVFLLLIALNIWLAVCINDAEDIHIDKLSNPDRPLIKGEFTGQQWQKLQLSLLFLIIFGLSTMNTTVTFFLILAQMAYYIYSAQPLRLKSHFISSSILIGLAAVAISMAGFFLISPDQHIAAYPIQAIWIIGISFAFISGFKDIKDFNGDKEAGIRTLPVVFGTDLAKKIIAFLFGVVFISIPLLLNAYSLLFFAICVSLFMTYLLTSKRYQEKFVFLLFFLYLVVLYLTFR